MIVNTEGPAELMTLAYPGRAYRAGPCSLTPRERARPVFNCRLILLCIGLLLLSATGTGDGWIMPYQHEPPFRLFIWQR